MNFIGFLTSNESKALVCLGLVLRLVATLAESRKPRVAQVAQAALNLLPDLVGFAKKAVEVIKSPAPMQVAASAPTSTAATETKVEDNGSVL